MKKTIASAIFAVLIFSLSGLTSCKNKSVSREQNNSALEQVNNLNVEIKKNVYPLPTSVDVIKMLSELGVGYISGISNPVENVKKKLRRSEQATNLGVYGADLSYATLFNARREVAEYLGATKMLSNELNMPEIYDESLHEKIKINVDTKDSLVTILTDVFNDTYTSLADNNQHALALLVVGGAWIEGMYLTTNVSEAAYNIPGISRVLLEQKKSFDLYLNITKPHLSDPDLSEFVKLLDPMKKVYDGLSTSLSQKNIIEITQTIKAIRSQIVEGFLNS